jgi:hypothetical protein
MGEQDFSALGEGIEYAARKSCVLDIERQGAIPFDNDMLHSTRLIIADKSRFQLVLCYDDDAKRCVFGGWGDMGSKNALVDFVVSGFQDDALDRKWFRAILALCEQFKVDLVTPNETTSSCLLGSGGCGRVFRVKGRGSVTQGSDNHYYALKVCLGDIACSHITAENSNFIAFSKQILNGPVVEVRDSFVSSDGSFAGLLVHPVGQPLPQTKAAIESAIDGLIVLARAGFSHGDARKENVVWMDDDQKCKWLDFRTLRICNSDICEAFKRDLDTFLRSVLPSISQDSLDAANQAAGNWFLCSVTEAHSAKKDLLDFFAPFWR